MVDSAMNPKIPVTVLTGALGAGKTTLLNDLLALPEAANTAVVINEFGDVGLDHAFINAPDDGVVELAAGCVCCSIRGTLVETFENLLRRRDNQRGMPFERVILETTGLADPLPILQSLMAHPYFMMRFALNAVVTVVDAVNGMATLEAYSEAVHQVQVADFIVMRKEDLATTAQVQLLKAQLDALNPYALQVDCRHSLLVSRLFALHAPQTPDRAWVQRLADVSVESGLAHHHHEHGHHHHHHHHASASDSSPSAPAHSAAHQHSSVRSYAFVRDEALSLRGFNLFQELLVAQHGPRLLRLKGLFRLADDQTRPMVMHVVQRVIHPPVRLPAWPTADTRTRVVVIADGLPAEVIERLFLAFSSVPQLDMPDESALADNPLSLRQG